MTDLENIITQLESQRAAIESALEALRGATGDTPIVSRSAGPVKKGGMTPEGRRRLAEAMKKRWAAKRTGTQAKKKAVKKAGGISAEGRKRLAEAMRRRWAAKRTSGQAKQGGRAKKAA